MGQAVTVAELLADAGVQWPQKDPDGPRHELFGEVEPPALARAYVPAIETEPVPEVEWQPGDLTDLWRQAGC